MNDYRKQLSDALDEVEQNREETELKALVSERFSKAGIDENQAGEAERLAAKADKPKERNDGSVIGIGHKTTRALTESQERFARGIIEGKTKRQAYKEAYPNTTASDQSITAAAYRLSKDSRIQKLITEGWEETTENIAEDLIATKRYVMRSLLALSKTGQQESSRLKALELLGRHAGMWEKQIQTEQRLTAEDLRRELSAHLKLVGS